MIKKILVSFLLICVLSFGITPSVKPMNLYASIFPSEEAIEAGYQLAEVINLILSQYKGDSVNVQQLLEAALAGMTDILDPYSTYMTADDYLQFSNSISNKLVGIGVTISPREDGRVEIISVLPDSPAEAAGLLAGDIILAVNGESATGFTTDAIVTRITNPERETAELTVERGGESLSFAMIKAEITAPSVLVRRLEDISEASRYDNLSLYRYMSVNTVGENTANDISDALADFKHDGVQGLILDLRGNTGGYLDVTLSICRMLVPRGIIMQTVNQAGNKRTYTSSLREVPIKNVVVLVDRYTASAAEVIASALQDSGAAVLVGETTYGKGVIQTSFILDNDGVLKLTTEEYFSRNANRINGIGITPDFLVERNTDQINDAALEKALEILFNNMDGVK